MIIGKAQELETEQIREAEVILGWSKHIAEEALHPDSKLKWIQTWSAGIDKLPLTELEKRNISLTNTSGVHAIPITEQIFGMLLSHTRYLQQAALLQRQKTWQPPEGQLTELRGKTLLITGVGEIGRETARIAEAFGMRVIGVRRSGKEAPHVEHMYTNEQLHEALGVADIVVNILPFTEETHHSLTKKHLQRCVKAPSSLMSVAARLFIQMRWYARWNKNILPLPDWMYSRKNRYLRHIHYGA